jgi:hypothetical protein
VEAEEQFVKMML